jgi:hypothetical protein
MAGSTHDWTHFTLDDVTQPVTMLASLPPSDNDCPLLVEPEPEMTTGLFGRHKERSRGVSAALWLANGYGEPDVWHVFLTFPESAPFERLGIVLPAGSSVVQSGKTDAEVVLPQGMRPDELLDFAIDACTRMAAEQLPGRWRAQIPNLSFRYLP